jgi:hypothetical protein
MPTGYTVDIKNGIDFKTFALNCARAFGACVTLKDAPAGGDCMPQAFKPSDYHLKAVEFARSELAALEAMDSSQLEYKATEEWANSETDRRARLAKKRKLLELYVSMLSKVRLWVPPTSEHVGLKEFMQKQIEASIDWDCGGGHDNTQAVLMTGAEWAASRRARLTRDVEYHEREHAAEVSRCEGRTAWVQALRDSL